jgi:hypothetical protein
MALKTTLVRRFMKCRTFAKEPALIPICSSCGLIRDAGGVTVDQEGWVTKRTYAKTHEHESGRPSHAHLLPGLFHGFHGESAAKPEFRDGSVSNSKSRYG